MPETVPEITLDHLRELLEHIPIPVQWALFGSELPAMTIEAMRRLARAWRACGDACDSNRRRLLEIAARSSAWADDAAGDRMASTLRGWSDDLDNQRRYCHAVAQHIDDTTSDTVKNLAEMLIFGVVVAYQVAFLATGGAVGAFPVMARLAAARAVFLQMLERLVLATGARGAAAAALRIGLLGGTFAAVNTGIDYGIQAAQLDAGLRTRLDTDNLIAMALNGVGAVAGGHLAAAGMHKLGLMAGRTSTHRLATQALAGLSGTLGGALFAAPVTGGPQLTGAAVFSGFAQGLAGASVQPGAHHGPALRVTADPQVRLVVRSRTPEGAERFLLMQEHTSDHLREHYLPSVTLRPGESLRAATVRRLAELFPSTAEHTETVAVAWQSGSPNTLVAVDGFAGLPAAADVDWLPASDVDWRLKDPIPDLGSAYASFQPPPDHMVAVRIDGAHLLEPQLGSHPGGVFRGEDGARWYVKDPGSDVHARVEVLANDLYRAAGVLVPDVDLVHLPNEHFDRTGIGIRSGFVVGTDPHPRLDDPSTRRALHQDFAVHAWLANWDVVGSAYDNLQFSPQHGRPIVIESGGALLHRAQGAPKGEAFGRRVSEIDTLRDRALNPTAHHVFADVSESAIRAGVDRIRAITEPRIDQLVDRAGLPKTTAEALKVILKERRFDLIQRFGAVADSAGTSDPREARLLDKTAAEQIWGPVVAGLHPDVVEGLREYTVDDAYHMNDAFRGVRPFPDSWHGALLATRVNYLDAALDLQPTPQEIDVTRVVPLRSLGTRPADLENVLQCDHGYMSTSLDPHPAVTAGAGTAVLHLRVPTGTPALYLARISANANESELLLGRGRMWMPERVVDADGAVHVYGRILAEAGATPVDETPQAQVPHTGDAAA
ncbi:MAG: hypothetical protein HOQ24_02115 [Mycobacteriaceae bacterium]|nr:hypothetical protein [Mycobacteriaceae bacterium]